MTIKYNKLHSQGIRVCVRADTTSKGPFRADVSCGVTGKWLGGIEVIKTLEEAIEKGKTHARKFAY